jgi:hypothetical protein
MSILQTFYYLVAVTAGGLIGYGFGTIQNLAYRRNMKRQAAGQLNNGWAVMPGSFKRIAYLLVTLFLVQILCPLLFVYGVQWFVSAGVVLGYGWVLYQNFLAAKARNPRV